MSVFQLNKGGVIKPIVFGVLISLAFIFIMTCVICLALLFFPSVPYSAMPYIMLAADAVGCFIGAWFAASRIGSRGLVNGLICSGAVFILMLIAGFISDSGTLTLVTPLKLAVMLLFGALGGIKGVNRKERLHIK